MLETLDLFYDDKGKPKVFTYLVTEFNAKTSAGVLGFTGIFRKSYLPRLIAGIVYSFGSHLTFMAWNSIAIPIMITEINTISGESHRPKII